MTPKPSPVKPGQELCVISKGGMTVFTPRTIGDAAHSRTWVFAWRQDEYVRAGKGFRKVCTHSIPHDDALLAIEAQANIHKTVVRPAR